MPAADGGLGTALVGEKIVVNSRSVAVTKLLGEGGFSYVYLVKELSDTALGQSLHSSAHGESSGGAGGKGGGESSNKGQQRRAGSASGGKEPEKPLMVLKVTSIHSRSQRDIAEKEAKLLSRLSHPSIIKMFDTCYRQVGGGGGGGGFLSSSNQSNNSKPQHIILMEYCEGGHALDVCNKLASAGKRFDLSTLIIAFGQICNAVSYLHAQRPPIVHRDLKPVNFLVKNGAYKLCDFGSAVFGHVDLRTQKARAEAEEVIEKTTTQMFRAPEMVDLYSAKRLTQATDVWALGCCLYSLAFLQNCFEEGSNLAILSRKYKIPDDNPYGDGLVELLDRMLTVDAKARSDMTEVILCLSAVYSGRPLPPRKKPSKPKKDDKDGGDGEQKKSGHRGDRGAGNSDSKDQRGAKKKKDKGQSERVGTYRTDGQGIYDDGLGPSDKKEARKLNPNSAAARRRQAAGGAASSAPDSSHQPATATAADLDFTSFHDQFDQNAEGASSGFSTASNPFTSVTSETGDNTGNGGNDIFGAFDNADNNTPSAANAFANFDTAWGDVAADGGTDKSQSGGDFAKFDSNERDRTPPRRSTSGKEKGDPKKRKPRRKSGNSGEAGSGSGGGGDGLNESFNDMNVSNPDAESRKHRSREGEKRHGSSKGASGERRRKTKDGEDERSAPRRNRSGRDASRTSG